MATLFWVGSTGSWDASNTANWSLTSGGATGAGPPTQTDDVRFDGNSGAGTITIAAGATAICRNFDCTGFVGTFEKGSGGSNHNVYGSYTLSAGMTYNTSHLGATTFFATGSVTITTAGKTMGVTIFNGSGGTWTLQDSWTGYSGGLWTHTQGTITTNNFAVSISQYNSSGVSPRTLNLGSSTVTLTTSAGLALDCTTATNLTINAGTSTITLNGGGGFAGGGKTWNTVSIATVGSNSITGANTFATLTLNGPANKSGQISIAANQIITGTLTINANSSINRYYLFSSVVGTPRTLTAGALVCTNVIDFSDITGAGTATWTTAASGATFFGDALGNSGITMTTAAPQAWLSNVAGSWSDVTKWTSRVPLPQDDVSLAVLTSAGVTQDMPRIGRNVSAAGATGGSVGTTVGATMYGSLNTTGLTTWGPQITLQGRGAQTVTSGGTNFTNSGGGFIVQTVSGGSYTFNDAINSSGTFTVSSGTATLTGAMTVKGISIAGGTTVSFSGVTWTVTGTGVAVSASSSAVLTTTGSTINLTDTSVTAKTFAGGGLTYNNVSITGGGTGTVTFTGANTFSTLTIGVPKSIILPASTTQTVTRLSLARGSSGNTISLASSTPGTQATISTPNLISSDWLVLQDSRIIGGGAAFAGNNSTNVSNNTGWTFAPAVFTDTASGAVVFSGSRAEARSGADARTGALVLVGAATEAKLSADARTGQLLFIGSKVEQLVGTNAAVGQLLLQGSAAESKRGTDAASGTLILGGSVLTGRVFTDAATGTLLISGISLEQIIKQDSATGTLILTGIASEGYSVVLPHAGHVALADSAMFRVVIADRAIYAVSLADGKLFNVELSDV